MAKAIEVARYLIQLAASEDEPDLLSHLRLQKLLYYVQGWSLAMRGKAMFRERIEAWAHGPVVRSIYPVFADYGFESIPPDRFIGPTSLEPAEEQFIASVWKSYKGFSASCLREMTHQEAPWRDARAGLDPAARCDRQITVEAMRDFFSHQPAR